jgi:hypothetical protein
VAGTVTAPPPARSTVAVCTGRGGRVGATAVFSAGFDLPPQAESTAITARVAIIHKKPFLPRVMVVLLK